jgi:hypothetical protein
MPRGQRDESLRPYSQMSIPEPLLFFQVAPQLYTRRRVDPVPNPLLLRKSASTGYRTRIFGSVARNTDHWTTEMICLICLSFNNSSLDGWSAVSMNEPQRISSGLQSEGRLQDLRLPCWSCRKLTFWRNVSPPSSGSIRRLLRDWIHASFAPTAALTPPNVLEVEVNLRPTVIRPVCLGVRRPSGTRDQFCFLLEISFRQLRVCYFVAPSLTRGRDCNLLYNCLWTLPEQSLLGRSPAELNILLSHLKLPQPGGPGPCIYIPQVLIHCSSNCSSASNRLTLPRSRYFFYPEDGGDTFLRNVSFLQDPRGFISQKTALLGRKVA